MLPHNILLLRHGYSQMNAVVDMDHNEYDATNWHPNESTINLIRTQPDSQHRLHPLGITQAQAASQTLHYLFPQGFDKVYVSPFKRTIETAHHALHGYNQDNIYLDSRIVERDWGSNRIINKYTSK